MLKQSFTRFAAVVLLSATSATAQVITADEMSMTGSVSQVSVHQGMMTAEIAAGDTKIEQELVFEPYQMADELFSRNDLVFLMRHGPTDWDKRDMKNVAPTDCENQRILSPEGEVAMEAMGKLLGANLLLPARIEVSEWCRNQQTLDQLLKGFDQVAEGLSDGFAVETNPDLNLLLSLQGAPDVEGLRQLVTDWDGAKFVGSEYEGRLLIVTHFTNIEELTNFSVYEGEILVVDPKRENRVIGYLRLRSAGPDEGHFTQ